MSDRAIDDLIRLTLSAAVPMHVHEIRGHTADWLLQESQRCADVIAGKGDVLQYGGKGCADAFNALARGLACAALVAEGGVTWQGMHWCAEQGELCSH